jgi:hypothetical protein
VRDLLRQIGRFDLDQSSAPCRFPPPWTVEDIGGSFVVKASNDRPLIFIYYGEGIGPRSLARLLTRNAARRIAVGIAKLPKLLGNG